MSTPRSALFCTQCDCTAAKLRIFSCFCKKLSTFYFPGNKPRMMRQQKLSELHPPLHPNGGTAEPASSERAAENQFVRDQMLAQSLLAARTISICVRSTSCGTRARMAGRQNLPVPHAKPFYTRMMERLNLPISAHKAGSRFVRKQMLSRSLPAAFPRPIDRTAKSVNSAREAESRFGRGYMLAQPLPTADTFFPRYPILII